MAQRLDLSAIRPSRRYRVSRVVNVDGRAVAVYCDGYAVDDGPARDGLPCVNRSTVGPIYYGDRSPDALPYGTRERMAVTGTVNGQRIGHIPVPKHSQRTKWHPVGRYASTSLNVSGIYARNAEPRLAPGF